MNEIQRYSTAGEVEIDSLGDLVKFSDYLAERDKLPEDVRSFIYTVTLFLQANRAKTPEQMDDMFRNAYKLYIKYDVESVN